MHTAIKRPTILQDFRSQMNVGTGLLIAFLMGFLGISFYFAFQGLSLDVEVPASGTAMLVAGTVLSIVVGGGLMWLVFYSSRHGYDEPPTQE
jgi:hypothetical protein